NDRFVPEAFVAPEGTTRRPARWHGGRQTSHERTDPDRRRSLGGGGDRRRGGGARRGGIDPAGRDREFPLHAVDADGSDGDDGHVGQSRRRDSHGDVAGRDVRGTGAGDRREVLVHVQHAGHLRLLLRPAPPDEVHGRRAVNRDIRREIDMDRDRRVLLDGGKDYLARYGKGTVGGKGWQSFDHGGVHFIGLVNVESYKAKGLGSLGAEQLEWLEDDVRKLSSSTPVVVFTHVPLWAVYAKWGWATDDGEQALGYLKRFGSVTVLNGHIHQVLQKVEGNVAFHTA